ncbi:MAG: DUF4388 domain-containing protein [Thermomicrobiales bacterium]
MSTIGELSDISVPDLIEIFSRRKHTGRLTIRMSDHEVQLFFHHGRLVFVTSSDLTLRLGRMLIRQGTLSSHHLLEALSVQAEAGNMRPIGAILVDKGWVTEEDLSRCVEEQSIEALARVISDQAGMFVFDAGPLSPGNIEPVPLTPEELLRKASERAQNLRDIRSRLPRPSAPLTITTEGTGAIAQLPAAESMVISALRTGAKSLAELTWQMALDERTLGEAVLNLCDRGMLVPGGEARPHSIRTPEPISQAR